MGSLNAIVEKMKREVEGHPNSQYALLSDLREIAAVEKNDVLELSILEKMTELRPGYPPIRFSLAYKHGEVGNSSLALRHYLKIPPAERTAVAWNNLGAAFADFGMPIKAMEAYRVSENENETLAMCNIGFKLLAAGLFPEAKQEADKAAAIKGHHKNVPLLLARLNEAPEEEDTKLEETLENAKEKAAFYQRLGEAILKATSTSIASNWMSPDGPLEGTMEGGAIRFFGSQQRPTLGGILTGAIGGQVLVTHRFEYTGRLRGSMIVGEVKRWRDGETSSLLGSSNEKSDVVMVFNEDYSQISVMENPTNVRPRFYVITRS